MSVSSKHAGRRDPDLWERTVNSHWGEDQPVLSGQESIAAAKKLWRHALGKTFRGEIRLTSGNRYSWGRREHKVVRSGGRAVMGTLIDVLIINPDRKRGGHRGLRAMIHDLSHYFHRRLHPGESDHSRRQAQLEARLVRFAVQRGWHKGALAKPEKPARPKPDLVVKRHRDMVARRDRWKAQLERSKRLLAKADREVRSYERRHRERLGLA